MVSTGDSSPRSFLKPLVRLFSQPPHQELLSFDQVAHLLRGRTEIHRGTRPIPLDHIVGSVGRYRDFTRAFMPLNEAVREHRDELGQVAREVKLPPIDVYDIGGVYFVRDGNHRVALARAQGLETVDARVTEIRSRVPLTPDVDVDDLILKAELAEFLTRTRLDHSCPQAVIELTEPGRYALLAEHIEVHRYYLCVEQNRDVPFEEAAHSWYDHVYLPVVEAIRDVGVLREFPRRTEGDLYLWVAYHRERLRDRDGEMPPDREVASVLAEQFSDRPVVGFVRSIARAIRAAVKAVGESPAPPSAAPPD